MKQSMDSKLERWLGRDELNHISDAMKPWYGPRIAVAGVPGAVWAKKGGDFEGKVATGRFSAFTDFAVETWRQRFKRWSKRQRTQANMGFSSLSDLISEATAGKRNDWSFNKAGSTGVVGVTNSLWGVGTQPAAGANASNAPGGDAPTDATLGAFFFNNPSAPDTQHIVSAFPSASVGGNTMLLYDRIFQVNKTMNSTATEAVSGVPTRYQSSISTNQDYSGGNFLFVEVGGTPLAATGHNWTVCTYLDQDGNAANLPSLAGNASAIVRRLDHPTGQWFAPLANQDFGVKTLTQMQCDALVATGVINFVIGHPIAWMPCPLTGSALPMDYINSAFQLTRIFDDAALAFLEVTKPSTTATTYTGQFTSVYG